MTEAVDGRRQHEHVHRRVNARRQQSPSNAEDRAQGDDPNRQTEPATLEEGALPPVVLDVFRIALDHVLVLGFFEVVEHVAELDRPEAHQVRTVGIAFLVGKRVVLAMDRHPFPGRQSRCQPQRESKHPGDGGMQHQRPVRRGAVQVNSCAKYCNLDKHDRRDEAYDKRSKHNITLRRAYVSGKLAYNGGKYPKSVRS